MARQIVKSSSIDKENVVWRVCSLTAQVAGLGSSRGELEVTMWFTELEKPIMLLLKYVLFKYLQN